MPSDPCLRLTPAMPYSQAVVDLICEEAGLKPMARAAENVLVVERCNADRRLNFLLNFYPSKQTVTELPPGKDLLSGRECTGSVELPPFGVAIIEG